MACDDAVLAATGNPRGYAGCLIGLLERSCARHRWSMAQAAVARAREASVRIARILQAGTPANTRVGRGALALAGAACVTCCGVLLYSPRLLVFAPAQGEIATPTAFTAPYDGRLAPPASSSRVAGAEVVPAAFHVAQTPVPVHRAVLKHAVAPHRRAERTMTLAVARQAAAGASAEPLVRASLEQPHDASRETSLHPIMAMLPMPQAEKQVDTGTLAAPVVILVAMEMPQDSPDEAPAAAPAAGQKAAANAVNVQTLQIVVADETGVHVQIYRIVVVPAANAQGVVSHSI